MAEADGGYDYDFVDELKDELTCIVCHLALKNPLQIANCGHRFCKSCFTQLKDHSSRTGTNLSCPYDRDVIHLSNVFPDKAAERSVLSLQVRCGNFRAGCIWIGEVRHIQKHEEECQVYSEGNTKKELIEQLDSMKIEMHNIKKDLSDKDKKIQTLQKKVFDHEVAFVEQKGENERLKTELRNISQKVLNLEQVSQNNNPIRTLVYEWIVDYDELIESDEVESDPFYTLTNPYCFQMCASYDDDDDDLVVTLKRSRGEKEQVGHLKKTLDFRFTMYTIATNGYCLSESEDSSDTSNFNIGKGYASSRGVDCLQIDNFRMDEYLWNKNGYFTVYCEISSYYS